MAATRWTVERVLALAPDASSAKAARRLASPRTWSELGSTESLVWGRCQGSAKDPYQVTVDVTEPAFRCTCPSRKLPCKHGLGLLLLWAAGDGSVAEAREVAGFAGEWAGRRAERGSSRAVRTARRADTADPDAHARRARERVATMTAGLEELERWLVDVTRQGLAAARRQPFAFWDATAARLVDAQLPGLADRVRALSGAVHSRPDWADHLLAELGRCYLAVRAWHGRELLDPDLAADLRVVVGWARRSDEVLGSERVHDRWHVVGRCLGDDGRLQSQRTWLVGETSGEVGVLLDFAAAGAALPVAQLVGTVVEGNLVFYPGAPPRRALLTGEHRVVATTGAVPGGTSIAVALDGVATALAGNPWRSQFPVALSQVVAVVAGDEASVVDGECRALPLAAEADRWVLLALTGGQPADLFGEWEDGHLRPASVALDGELVAL